MAQKLKFVLGRVENIVGKGENARYKITNYINTRNIFWKFDFGGPGSNSTQYAVRSRLALITTHSFNKHGMFKKIQKNKYW